MKNKLKSFLEVIASQEALADNEYARIADDAKTLTKAYDIGENDGKIMLARNILEEFFS